MHCKLSGCSPSSVEGRQSSERTTGPKIAKSSGYTWEVALLPHHRVVAPPAAWRCLVSISSAALGRACSVGISGRATSCPAGSDDSHPAKFPLKIHPCRQLSDVCDGNTWLQQQHQPRWRRAGLAPGRRCVPGRPAPCPLKPALQVPPLRVGPSLNPLGKLMVCPSFALLFLELLMGEVTNPPAFLCVPYGKPHGLRTLGRHPPRPSFLYKVLGISSLPLPPEQHLGGRQSVSSLHGSFRPAAARKEAGVLSRPCMCIQRTGVETG